MTPLYAALFGLAFGSFAAAALQRVVRGESLNGRSHCDACRRVLRPWELIPVISYLILLGRCASCRTAIGVHAPLVEATCATAFVAAFVLLSPAAAVAVSASFVAMVAGLSVARQKRGVQR